MTPLIELLAPLLTLVIFIIIAMLSDNGSIWSPMGMTAVTVSAALMITPMFEQKGDSSGYVTVIIALIFYLITVKSIIEFFKAK